MLSPQSSSTSEGSPPLSKADRQRATVVPNRPTTTTTTNSSSNRNKRLNNDVKDRGESRAKSLQEQTSKTSQDQALIDELLERPSAGGGLPPFLRKKIAFREATHSESLRGIVVGVKRGGERGMERGGERGTTRGMERGNTALQAPAEPDNSAALKRDEKYGFVPGTTNLFPRSRLQPFLAWSRIRPIGPGLSNLGNTCFLNSVLQCLMYTAPLAEFLLAREHSRRCACAKGEFCGLCVLERLTRQAFESGHGSSKSLASCGAIRPVELVSSIRAVARHFRPGRQEDAHEFLRYLLEAMQRAALSPGGTSTSLDPRSRETTVINRIFGGYLQSTVSCDTCRHVSRTFDHFLDLSLEVRTCDSVSAALRLFTTPELLTRGNRYRCEACHRLTDAHKQFSIYKAPEVLTLQLKRFSVNLHTGQPGKLSRPVDFPERLDISSAMSDPDHGTSSHYRLYAVIVHEGASCNSGHYHAFVRNSTDIWHSMNDSSVHQVSLATVLKQRAYILLYQRENTNMDVTETASVSSRGAKQQTSPVPSLPQKRNREEERMTAVLEASRAYMRTKTHPTESDTRTVAQNTRQDSTAVTASQIDIAPHPATASLPVEDEAPQLVPAHTDTELVASSMWHMASFHPAALQTTPMPTINRRARSAISHGWNIAALPSTKQQQ